MGKIIIIVSSSVVAFLLLSFLLFLFLIKPNRKRAEMDKFKSVKYAHRGLHGEGAIENSMTAFKNAVSEGYGIELDIRLSKDGRLVVFHDSTLDRVTKESGSVIERSAEELRQIKLLDTDDTIPTFDEVLALVSGKVPLLVEIKEDVGGVPVAEAAVKALSKYEGDFIVESFNPLALGYFKKHMPNVMRGFLSQNFLKEKKHRKPLYFFLQNMLLNVVARPDFISYNHKDYKNAPLRLIRGLFKTPTICWTVRSEKEEAEAYEHKFDGVIFENYIPG